MTSPRCLARLRGSYSAGHGTWPSRPRFLTSRAARLGRGQHHLATASTVVTLRPAPRASAVTVPLARSRQSGRHYIAVSKPQSPRHIAVIGAGLTGLTTAWYLARELPKAKITIYDAGKKLGGWIDTVKHDVKTPDGKAGTVVFERAARMVKPQRSAPSRVPRWDDLVFYDLVTKLNLTDQLMSSKQADETVAGFIYYPDHLVPIPILSIKPFIDPIGTLKSLANAASALTEPAFRDLIPGIINMNLTNDEHRLDLAEGRTDMSVGDYWSHRFGNPGLVDKVFSAMLHGVTGGDVWTTSMGSGIMADQLVSRDGLPITKVPIRMADYELVRQLAADKAVFDLASKHLQSSALWFRDGFGTLAHALADALRTNPNVTLKLNEPVTKISYANGLDQVSVSTKSGTQRYEKVISTIFAKHLHEIATPELPSLASSEAVTIMLVNLWYPVPHLNYPHHGFGYLIPQATPYSQNPECLLGVIFDSDREFPLPTPTNPNPTNRGADTLQGTKLTVMMGGHYWSSLPPTALPTPDEAIEQAKRAVARHLKLPQDISDAAHGSAKLCADCIPQHLVGHAARMRAAHGELEWGFKGRLAVAGQSYQNPGVLGMLRAGRDVAMQIAGRQAAASDPLPRLPDGRDQVVPWTVGETGLERFTRRPDHYAVEKALLPLRYNSGAVLDEDGQVVPKAGGGNGE
ncbi:FAD/NAD(P)-binding domain-containing protein [Parathielavia hyrcaniae]|uniref:Protoporphyrinogen oxidase n=1 Tax=Parathielavia hyrcaniae TaxID=113614 RepID=A0AAN6T5S8_9PEZI|nr:FAD/NAD(P)-binding domain-containing protein [Parathielavia hyrcaniae]